MTEKEKIQAAAVLCGKWNKLCEQIAYKESLLKQEFNAEKQLHADAEKYAQKKTGFAGFLETLRDWGLCILLLGTPIVLMLVCYKLDLYTEFIANNAKWVGVLEIALFIIACVVSTMLNKNAYKRKLEKFKKKNKSEYEKKSAEIQTHNANLKSEIYKIRSTKIALERDMRDRTVCCIHPDYWYAGPRLFYLIDTGRAETLKEAINLFEHIKENERRRLAEEAAARERQWEKIEQMLDEKENLDKLKRTIQSAISDVF